MPGSSPGTTQTSQTVNTNQGPWNEQGPYLTQGFRQAGNLLGNTKPQYYPGSTVSPLSPATYGGAESLFKQGAQSPLFPAASETAMKTLQGGYLDPTTNPWLAKTFAAGADDVSRAYNTAVAPGTDAAFSRAGRYGSGAHNLAMEGNERALGSTLGNLATNIYGGNYQAERGRQEGAVNNIGNTLQAGLIGPGAMLAGGTVYDQQAQKELADSVARWNVEQNPDSLWQQLAKYMSTVGSGNWGQSGTTTSFGEQPAPAGANPWMQGAGGLLSLASLATPVGAGEGGFGASALGNIVGGIGGLFSRNRSGSASP